ncbi:acyltransferase [Caulobacter sp. RHG1]|uniref:acyltransferase family protein n=1 Tax=Caulobacter sp. (strain RHG1) TaxID=2545762 RepID=UPI001554A2B6|nr:acyltransferase [Caulobacter sp. RHG1]NQE63151.1 hypothetical protein [Caulobacter sp. RHG1]
MDKRIEVLDGLRGVAVLLVVIQHVLEFFPIIESAPADPLSFVLQNYLNLGRLGVIIFFLISGYLIPFTLRDGANGMSAFWVSRFFRLYPLYWCSLGLAVAVFYFIPVREPASARDAVLNLSMFQLALGARNVLEPYWTLFVELLFYAICAGAFLVRLNKKHQPVLFVVIFSAVIVSLTLPVFLFSRSPGGAMYNLSTFASYLMIMFAGMFIRMDEMEKYRGRYSIIIVAAIAIAMAAYTWLRLQGDFNKLLSPASVLISTSLGLLIFLFRRKLAPLLSSRILVSVGVVSYGIYLFHPIVLHVAAKTLPHGGGVAQFVIFIAVVLVGTFVVSELGYRAVEKPAIALGQRLRRRLLESRALVQGG